MPTRTTISESNKQSKSISSEKVQNSLTLPQKVLQKYDEGEAIEQLQEGLKKLGYSINVTGLYDEQTTNAITDIQLQKKLGITGVFDRQTAEILDQLLQDDNGLKPGDKVSLQSSAAQMRNGTTIITNPHDQLVLVNKEHALPKDYVPVDLVTPDVRFPFTEQLPKKQMRAIAADALEELFAAADQEGLELFAQSGYRSFDRQTTLFASYVQQHGEEAANKFSARPGESEHQTGLTMDVTSPSVNYQLTTDFAKTAEGKWLSENAAQLGLLFVFLKGKNLLQTINMSHGTFGMLEKRQQKK